MNELNHHGCSDRSLHFPTTPAGFGAAIARMAPDLEETEVGSAIVVARRSQYATCEYKSQIDSLQGLERYKYGTKYCMYS